LRLFETSRSHGVGVSLAATAARLSPRCRRRGVGKLSELYSRSARSTGLCASSLPRRASNNWGDRLRPREGPFDFRARRPFAESPQSTRSFRPDGRNMAANPPSANDCARDDGSDAVHGWVRRQAPLRPAAWRRRPIPKRSAAPKSHRERRRAASCRRPWGGRSRLREQPRRTPPRRSNSLSSDFPSSTLGPYAERGGHSEGRAGDCVPAMRWRLPRDLTIPRDSAAPVGGASSDALRKNQRRSTIDIVECKHSTLLDDFVRETVKILIAQSVANPAFKYIYSEDEE
jgi:hypothetical protein